MDPLIDSPVHCHVVPERVGKVSRSTRRQVGHWMVQYEKRSGVADDGDMQERLWIAMPGITLPAPQPQARETIASQRMVGLAGIPL